MNLHETLARLGGERASGPRLAGPRLAGPRCAAEEPASSAPDWTAPLAIGDPFARLMWLDAKLVAAGFPPMSPWWTADLARFYESRKRWGVYLVGRGGGKSTTLTRVAAAEVLFTERSIPPGQRWIWPFVSVAATDARRRITEIAAILAAVGLEVEPSYPMGHATIETDDARGNPVAFIALAATIAGVSGPSSIGATVDEEAKLRDRASGANPSREIIASLVQTFRARPGIRAIRCSSAWTEDSTHAVSVREGDTEHNHVGHIGDEFLEQALEGFETVAEWEERQGRGPDATTIRDYGATLTAESPRIPTWLANPTIGALASRREVEALPATSLDGLSRTAYWLRENGSAPPGAMAGGWTAPRGEPRARTSMDWLRERSGAAERRAPGWQRR